MEKSIESFSARTKALCPTEEMAQKCVAIIGVGSGGSLVAWWLAATGVGKIILIDFDELEVCNVWRHLCDCNDLGKLKVDAVAAKIKRVNPYCKVVALPWDLREKEDEFADICRKEDVSLLVVATDTAHSRQLANEVAFSLGKTAVYGACFENAQAGEVILCRPKEACYGCIQAAVANKEPEYETNESFDYSDNESNEEPHLSASGLGMSVALIANLQSHIALWALREQSGHPFPLRGNYFLLTTGPFPIVAREPFSFRQWFVAKRKSCLICRSHEKAGVLKKRGQRILEALVAKEGAL